MKEAQASIFICDEVITFKELPVRALFIFSLSEFPNAFLSIKASASTRYYLDEFTAVDMQNLHTYEKKVGEDVKVQRAYVNSKIERPK